MSAFSHWDLQKAIYGALTADSTLMTLITGVYDRVTEGAAFPYVTIGEAFSRDWSTKTTSGAAVNLNLHVFSQEAGRKQAALIMNRMHALLHDANLTLTENTLIMLQFLSSDIILEEDGYTYHGILRFRALTQSNS